VYAKEISSDVKQINTYIKNVQQIACHQFKKKWLKLSPKIKQNYPLEKKTLVNKDKGKWNFLI